MVNNCWQNNAENKLPNNSYHDIIRKIKKGVYIDEMLFNESNKKITYMKYDEDSNTISHIYEIINIDYSPLSLYNAYKDKSKNLKKN